MYQDTSSSIHILEWLLKNVPLLSEPKQQLRLHKQAPSDLPGHLLHDTDLYMYIATRQTSSL